MADARKVEAQPQILIVDDVQDNLNAICDLLADKAHSVLRTTHAERAYMIAVVENTATRLRPCSLAT